MILIEDVMNRFAAELLMPAEDFRRRSRKMYENCKGVRADFLSLNVTWEI
ncbi:MAG: ImmA/IrrE family metallo-endopeptidase [Lachnospiraceae bacterium]|nr:ImmA/IrrE family metallo-endopeptidase [Lachnospiraceae bacterium]